MIKQALYQHLISDAGVAAVIGARLYAGRIPEQAFNAVSLQPCAVYQRIGVTRDVRHCGTSTLAQSSMQIDAYALSYEQADSVARAIKAALLGWTGLAQGVQIKGCMLQAEYDLTDPEPGLYRVSMSFSLWHNNE